MRRLAVLLMASLFLVACGTTPSPSAAAPSSTPAGSAAGAEIVGPVILDADHTSASVPVGRMVVFNVDDPETWTISADPEGIVSVQEGANDGSATFNPGAEALEAGKATVTLTNPAGDKLVFTITVE
jgi:hypothetical protein